MSHLLLRLGEAALQFRKVHGSWLPPLISRRKAMTIRKAWLEGGKEWPYEHIVPGIPKSSEPYRGGFQKGHKRVAAREERLQQIQKAMDKMPQLIAEYRASRRVPWDDVTPADRLLLTPRLIKEKYVYKKLK